MTIIELARAICPGLPESKQVKSVHDSTMWFKVSPCGTILYLPPINYLKSNVTMLDKASESIVAFSVLNTSDPAYNWKDLNLYSANTPDDILYTLDNIMCSIKPYKVACDIETRRVEWEDNRLLSLGISTDDSTCYALYNIPIEGSKHTGTLDSKVFNLLQRFFDWDETQFIWHNGKFDCGRLQYLCNLRARIDRDTMLHHYCGINEKRGTHGLKDLAQLYLQAPPWEEELDNLKRKVCKEQGIRLKDFMYDNIPTHILVPYMQRDCIATYRLDSLFDKLARSDSQFIYEKLIEASNVYMRMELAGITLDVDYMEDLEFELEKEIQEADKRVKTAALHIWDPVLYAQETGAKVKVNEPLNIKSPKQLKWALEKVVKHPIESTDAATMDFLAEEFADTPGDAKDFVEAIASLRKANKYMDTYIQGMRECLCRDMRIRGTFNLHGTETGRLSSSSPNMQNIPRDKKIKNLLKAAPGYTLLQLDYSQAELRVLALLSQDPYLIGVYKDGKDLHDAVATEMFGPNFDKEQRVMAKTINFGIAYGRGPGSIATTFKKSMSEARDIINRWFKPMPKVKEWIDNRKAMARRGEPCVTFFGRERHFVLSESEMYHIQNEYINTPIQSIASDFTMFSLLRIDKYLRENHLDAKIVTTVHDSIILEVRDDPQLIDKVAQECLNIMASTPQMYVSDCDVPFKADAEVGYSWGNMSEWKPPEVII